MQSSLNPGNLLDLIFRDWPRSSEFQLVCVFDVNGSGGSDS